MAKTSSWLCEYATAQLGRPYWMGTFGEIATQALLNYERKRFPNSYKATDFESQLGQKVHDCGGLVKACMMCDDVNGKPTYIAKYDQDARMLYESSRVRGDDMSKFPGIAGYLVYFDNLKHVGVYVGNNTVVEARGHAYGVVTSKVTNSKWGRWSDYWAVEYPDTPSGGDEVKYSDIREIRQGSTGEEVRVVQAVCMVTVDGIFGPKTNTAVKAFQKRKGLVQDGIVGEKTWQAIIEEWYKK